MLQGLDRYFNAFVEQRTEEVGQVILKNNIYYKELVKSKRNSLEEVLKGITKTSREQLLDYEDKVNYQWMV